MDDIKIWITYHDDRLIKQYNLRETLQVKLFKGNELNVMGKSINNLNAFYSELTTIYYMWKNRIYSQYIGFGHYRRMFHQVFRMPLGHCQVLGIVKDCDVLNNYKYAHNYQDMYDAIDILNERYGAGNKYSEYLLKGTVFIPFCCFIMHYSDFEKLCEFLFPVLFAWDKKNGLDMKPEKYMEKAQRDFRYDDVDYQCRAVAFLAERLISCYIVCNMTPFCVNTL